MAAGSALLLSPLFLSALLLAPAHAGPRVPAAPDGIGEVTVADDSGSVTLQLRLERCWRDRGLQQDGAPSAHMHPLHTGLTPRFERQPGVETCMWTGYRPSAHEEAGDTIVSYVLLVQQQGDALSGLWYEDHQVVPRSYYRAAGTLDGSTVHLDLVDSDGGLPATLDGLLVRSSD